MQDFESKVYEFEGRKFVTRKPSLAVENLWLRYAINEDGTFNRKVIRDLTQNREAVNEFMERLLKGDHSGIDWYNEGDPDIIGEVISDFFTRWSARLLSQITTPSDGSELEPSRQSAEDKELPSGTA